jgi:UDP-N-acetylmuramate dehydrogenase
MNTTACQLGYRTSVFKARPGRWTILDITLRLTRSRRAAPVTYGHLASALHVPLGHRPPLAEGAAGVAADRQTRGLSLPAGGPDARQAGSAFLNPVLDAASAARVSALGGQVYRDADGQQRASAGWLLELCGYSPGQRIGAGVYCSTARTLTVTARDGASAAVVRGALRTMAQKVRDSAGVQLAPEPVCPHA